MLPHSVLRVWGTGIVNWAIFAVACYLLWEWADGRDPPEPRAPMAQRALEETRINPGADSPAVASPPAVVTHRRLDRDRDTQGGWPYLAAGIALAILSCCGALPVIALGRLWGSDRPVLPPADRTQTIDRPDGTRLYVEFYGEKNGTSAPTLILTHGWSLDRSAWAYVIRDLAARFRIVAWDLPGHTRSLSPPNGDFSLEKMARDLEAVVQIAGKGPVILVGHSIGGMISQTFCRLFPGHMTSRVVGLAFVHTTYTNPLRTALLAPLWTAIEKPVIVPLQYLSIGLAPLVMLSNLQSYFSGSLHLATRIASFSGKQTWGQLDYSAWLAAIAWPGVMARGNLAMLAFDEQEQLRKLPIPVLVIAGRHDRMTKAEAGERIAELVPNSRETSIPSGHLGVWERPGDVATLLAEFAEHASDQQPSVLTEKQAGEVRS